MKTDVPVWVVLLLMAIVAFSFGFRLGCKLATRQRLGWLMRKAVYDRLIEETKTRTAQHFDHRKLIESWIPPAPPPPAQRGTFQPTGDGKVPEQVPPLPSGIQEP